MRRLSSLSDRCQWKISKISSAPVNRLGPPLSLTKVRPQGAENESSGVLGGSRNDQHQRKQRNALRGVSGRSFQPEGLRQNIQNKNDIASVEVIAAEERTVEIGNQPGGNTRLFVFLGIVKKNKGRTSPPGPFLNLSALDFRLRQRHRLPGRAQEPALRIDLHAERQTH